MKMETRRHYHGHPQSQSLPRGRSFSEQDKDIILFSYRTVIRHWLVWTITLILGCLLNYCCGYGPLLVRKSTDSCMVYKDDEAKECYKWQRTYYRYDMIWGTLMDVSPSLHFPLECSWRNTLSQCVGHQNSVASSICQVGRDDRAHTSLVARCLCSYQIWCGKQSSMMSLVWAVHKGSYMNWRRFVSLPRLQKVLARIFCVTLMVFLGLIDMFRFNEVFFGKWDPSGHTFIFGMAFLPWWFCHELLFDEAFPRRKVIEYLGFFMELILLYVNFSTASFYHYGGEITMSWLIVTALTFWLIKVVQREKPFLEDTSSASNDILVQVSSSPAVVSACFVLWCIYKAVLLSSAHGPQSSSLGSSILYDSFVGGCFGYFLWNQVSIRWTTVSLVYWDVAWFYFLFEWYWTWAYGRKGWKDRARM